MRRASESSLAPRVVAGMLTEAGPTSSSRTTPSSKRPRPSARRNEERCHPSFLPKSSFSPCTCPRPPTEASSALSRTPDALCQNGPSSPAAALRVDRGPGEKNDQHGPYGMSSHSTVHIFLSNRCRPAPARAFSSTHLPLLAPNRIRLPSSLFYLLLVFSRLRALRSVRFGGEGGDGGGIGLGWG